MSEVAIVTGGAGFIGSHLVDRLLECGFRVIAVDNFSTGREKNVEQAKKHPLFSFIKQDVARLALNEIRSVCSDPVSYIFHLAGLADIVPSLDYPIHYYRSNVTGTVNMLEIARNLEVKKFIYTASSSCYGIPEIFPTPESAKIQPKYPYALTKYLGEQLAMHWSEVYKLDAVSLRLFNVYGPRSRTTGAYGAVFGVFLAQKIAGKPFTIVGDGNQTRDFTFVTDVVDAFRLAAVSEVKSEIFNVGSGNTYSVNSLADLMGGAKTYIPKRPGEPDCTFADTTQIRKRLGWSPKVTFEEGVGHMLAHISDWRDAPVWTEASISEATKAWFQYLT